MCRSILVFVGVPQKYQNGKTKLRQSKALHGAKIMRTKSYSASDVSGGGLSGRALFNNSKELGSNRDWNYEIFSFLHYLQRTRPCKYLESNGHK